MTAVGATQGRPVIGVTTYREQAAWSVWNMSADLLPAVYTRSVEAAGGVVVLLPPQADGMARPSLTAIANTAPMCCSSVRSELGESALAFT